MKHSWLVFLHLRLIWMRMLKSITIKNMNARFFTYLLHRTISRESDKKPLRKLQLPFHSNREIVRYEPQDYILHSLETEQITVAAKKKHQSFAR